MSSCTAEFERLTAPLEGLRCDGSPFLTLTNPLALQNWTFPVIESLLVLGAIACLVHAVRWYRRFGDSTNLVVWGSLVLALLLIEPITYFPQWFGLENYMGLTFAHGQFTVQFLYDRLPLYIVAMYPVYGYVSFSLVQRTGVFEKYNPLVGATCVAAGFLALFEIVDTVGPQWGWWIWNPAVSSAHPSIGPIPLASIQMFSIALPFSITLTVLLVSRAQPRTGWKVVGDIVVVSIGVWPIMLASSIVPTLLNMAGMSLDTARWIWVSALMIGCLVVTAFAFTGVRHRRLDPRPAPEALRGDRFAGVCVVIYLLFGLVLWGAALPDYVSAADGVTTHGLRTGNIVLGIGAFVATAVFAAAAYAGNWGHDRAGNAVGVARLS